MKNTASESETLDSNNGEDSASSEVEETELESGPATTSMVPE